MPELRNDAQLRRAMMPIISKIVDHIITKLEVENPRLIQKHVYKKYSPKVYERTGEFKEAWEADNEGISGSHVDMTYGYAPDDMTYDPDLWQHGSHISGDARNYLADIIYQGLAGDIFGVGPWTKRRDAWTELKKDIDDKLDGWIQAAVRQNGWTGWRP